LRVRGSSFQEKMCLGSPKKRTALKKGFSLQSKKKARARHAIAWRAWVKSTLRDECFEFEAHLFRKRWALAALKKGPP
jgi:hypothetical protein